MNSNPKHMKILERLLKLPENKQCADCRSKAPRWASINLGIFICLQCSGIHRSLGVHISKVRSATLDSWLPEQVAFMQSMGNKKSNAYWEAELPLHYDRGQIGSFIHAKYVEKRWIPKDCKDNKSPPDSKHQLLSSRSSRRYGCIAEWTNSQHQRKVGRDFVVGENDRADTRPFTSKVPKDNSDNKDQHQEKKEKSAPSLDQRANPRTISVHGKPSIEPAQVVHTLGANGSLRKSEDVSNIKTSTASVPSVKVDYADVLFKTLFTDNSPDNDLSRNMNEWVRFDSDQESSTPEGKIIPKKAVGEQIMDKAKLAPKPSSSNVNPATKIENNQIPQTAMVPSTTGHYSEHQKFVSNNKQSLLEKPMLVSTSSVHLQRPAVPAQGVSSTVTPKLLKSRTTGSQLMMQNFQPGKLAVNSASYNMPSLYRPVNPAKGASTPPAKGSLTALPVSGYDYDFSFLTQEMFKRR